MKTTDKPERPAAIRRSYTPFIVLGVILVVAVAIALIASSGGDDPATGDAGSDAADQDDLLPLATAGVTVRGEALAPRPDSGDDPAVGSPAPTIEGVSPVGQATSVEYEEPTLLAFLAHWCPHCQAELPELVELASEGGLDDLDAVVVLTGTDENAPNYPPGPWLEREGWAGRVVLDDEGSPAGQAFGLTSYPYLVLVDGDGNVVDRHAGGLGLDGLREFVSQVG
jgi:cytochrome c biogenesis protein CcmG/thiol:disulfide interchange protein DsbE